VRLHFGLGSAKVIDRIEILWPSGIEETFTPTGIDRFVTLVEGKGTPVGQPR
jgi:hypothetical protein